MKRTVAVSWFLLLSGVGIWHSAPATSLQDRWDQADQETPRLSARSFPQLPGNLVRELERRGCRIPQSYLSAEPHNVVRGEFARRGQTDWAVLCSIGRVSTILVFWNGSEKNPAEIANVPDRNWLQTISGEGQIAFSRSIRAVDKKFIREHHAAYGGPEPPPDDHDGIEDAFAGKGSIVHYFSQRQWMKLAGAD